MRLEVKLDNTDIENAIIAAIQKQHPTADVSNIKIGFIKGFWDQRDDTLIPDMYHATAEVYL